MTKNELNVESIFRNSLDDVRSFLEEKHKDHHKIYNLCAEKSYDIQKFHARVAVYPFDDHSPQEFGQTNLVFINLVFTGSRSKCNYFGTFSTFLIYDGCRDD